MRGGAGNDIYVVDNAGDIVDESVAGSTGTDTVQSVDQLQPGQYRQRARRGREPDAARPGNINGTGNALNNVITGNGGANC